MGMFDGIEDASIYGSGVFFEDGVYKVEIIECRAKRSRKGKDLLFVECTILASSNPQRPVGSKASWCLNFSDHEAAAGNWKQFMCVACNVPPEQITAQVSEIVVGPTNPLKGYKLNLQASTGPTKSGGKFTKHIWEPYTT